MTEYIFLDTAALVALLNKKDQYHVQAVAKLDSLLKGKGHLLTTTHVFAETVTRILRRVSHTKAVEAGEISGDLAPHDRIANIMQTPAPNPTTRQV